MSLLNGGKWTNVHFPPVATIVATADLRLDAEAGRGGTWFIFFAQGHVHNISRFE